MSKSISAKFTSEVLELFSFYMDKNSEKLIEDAYNKGEKPTSPPLIPKTRVEDYPNGRVFNCRRGDESCVSPVPHRRSKAGCKKNNSDCYEVMGDYAAW